MLKKIGFLFLIVLCTLLVACGGTNEVVDESNVLITFSDVKITELDAENARVTADETLHDAAKDLLFQEMMVVEAEKAGITYEEFDLEALVNQTKQMFEYDEEAIAFLTAKSELYKLSPEEYIDTIWRDGLKKKLIGNKYLMEQIDFSEKDEAEVAIEIEQIRTELLKKYDDQIEFHF